MKLLILLLAISLSPKLPALSLQVEFHHLRSEKGSLKYILFKGDTGYPDDSSKGLKSGSLPATQKTLVLPGLEKGHYALTVIHDENDNGKLDKRLGIPTEGFGFSGNPAIFFGPPSYKRARFNLPEDANLELKMKYM